GCTSLGGSNGCAALVGNKAEGYGTGFVGCIREGLIGGGRGGGARVADLGELRLDGVLIAGNVAERNTACLINADDDESDRTYGAAFYVAESGVAEVANSIIRGNGGAGAEDAIHSKGTLDLVHVTITDNEAGLESVIQINGERPRTQIVASIIHDAGEDPLDVRETTDPELVGACILTNNSAAFSSVPGDLRNLVHTSSVGFTSGYALASGSEAVDLCETSDIAGAGFSDLAVRDLAGNPRPMTANRPASPWDAGALERQTGSQPRFADLGVTLDDGDRSYGPGQSMGYTMKLRNNGPDAVTGAGFRLELDGAIGNYSLIPFDSNWTCSRSGNVATCTHEGTLAAGQKAADVATQFNAPGGPRLLRSSILALQPAGVVDTQDANNRATETTSIGLDADLAVHAGMTPSYAAPGTLIQMSFDLENLGPDVASAPRITFTFHPDARDIEVDPEDSRFDCEAAQQLPNATWTVTCRASSIPVGQSRFVTRSRLPSAYLEERWEVRAEVLSGSQDPAPENNTLVSGSTVANAASDLRLTGAAPETVAVGEFASWSFELYNAGPGSATGAVVIGEFLGGEMGELFVVGFTGWDCFRETAGPYRRFECVARDDQLVQTAQTITVNARPSRLTGSELALKVTALSASEDPDTGPGSNSELILVTTVPEGEQDPDPDPAPDPAPGGDLLFSSSFEG
ncbi:MAG: hypothetical protein AAGE01_21965, partial [Pseudomonadota bacterium]